MEYRLIHHKHYRRLIYLASILMVTLLPILEVPPYVVKQDPTEQEVLDLGYSPVLAQRLDLAICILLVLHTFLIRRTRVKNKQRNNNNNGNNNDGNNNNDNDNNNNNNDDDGNNNNNVGEDKKARVNLAPQAPSPPAKKQGRFKPMAIKNYWTDRMLLQWSVFLLVIDFLLGVAGSRVRPFRFLRPLTCALLSRETSVIVKSAARTMIPLLETLTVLLVATTFWATIGINVFEGVYSDDNQFGAACTTGETHPFHSWERAFVTMYVLSTGDNFPDVMWPFATCGCAYTGLRSSTTPDYALQGMPCLRRRTVTFVYFISFIILAFLILGNCLLAVCYNEFENLTKGNGRITQAKQKMSMATAFYYLTSKGGSGVTEQDFHEVLNLVAKVSSSVVKPESIPIIWNHANKKRGKISLDDFISVLNMLNVTYLLRAPAESAAVKRTCCSSQRRKVAGCARQIIDASVMQLPLLDVVLAGLVMVTFLLLSFNAHKDSELLVMISNVLSVLFIIEAVLKLLAYGFDGYLQDNWNKFDMSIVVMDSAYHIATWTSPAFVARTPIANQIVQVIRIVKMFKLYALYVKQEKMRGVEPSSFTKLIHAIGLTLPPCLDIIFVLFLYMSLFAFVAMETLSGWNINTRSTFLSGGNVMYVTADKPEYNDWADYTSSMLSVLVIIVGNTWSRLMLAAEGEVGTLWVAIMLISFQFIGASLILNVIQSLFVAVFDTRFDEEEFSRTLEAHVLSDIEAKFSKNGMLHSYKRPPRLDYLMTDFQEYKNDYNQWRKSTKHLNLFDTPVTFDLPKAKKHGVSSSVGLSQPKPRRQSVMGPDHGRTRSENKRRRHPKRKSSSRPEPVVVYPSGVKVDAHGGGDDDEIVEVGNAADSTTTNITHTTTAAATTKTTPTKSGTAKKTKTTPTKPKQRTPTKSKSSNGTGSRPPADPDPAPTESDERTSERT